MAISYRSSSTAYGTSSPLSVTKPSGTVEGDVLIASRMYYGDDSTSTPPSGWTLIDYASEASPETDPGHRLLVYYKVAGSSEPSSYSWGMGGDQVQSVAIACYSAVKTSSPIDVFNVQSNGTSSSMTSAAVTTTAANAMLVFAGCAGQSAAFTATPPSGFTERVEYYADWRCQYIADKVQASTGSSGSATATLSVSRPNWASIIALKPLLVPNAPTINSATAGNTQVALAWTAPVSGDAPSGYKIRRGTSPGSYGTTIDVGLVTSYTNTGLSNGTTYYFDVLAYNAAGDGGDSSELSATPALDATLPGTPVFNSLVGTSTTLTATWSVATNATGYKVKYGASTGSYSTTVDVGNVNTYNITGLTNGTRYFVVVLAYNSSGDGSNSNELSSMPNASSFIKSKYNDMYAGDIILFESLFQLEAMTIGTHPSPTAGFNYKTVTVNGVNGYEFAVTRDVDGTGKNTWPAGSSYVNTGQAGSGFIDMYSFMSVSSRPFEYIVTDSTLIDPLSNNFTLLTGSGSTLYFGVANTKFDSIYFYSTAATYTTATFVYEYWNGSAWTAIPGATVSATNASNVSITADYKAAAKYAIIFTAPASWATTSVASTTAYWARIRVSAATGWTVNPAHFSRRWASRGKNQYGPSIAFMRRNSATWNDLSARAAVGNLEGYYDYGATVFGIAAGDVAGTWISADTINGFRVMSGSTTLGKWDTSGNITIGNTASGHTVISAGVQSFKYGSTEYIKFDSTGGGSAYFNAIVNISATGEIRQGTGTVGSNYTGIRLYNSGGVGYLAGYNNNTVQWEGATDGKLKAGAGNVILDSNGISVAAQWSSYTLDRAYKFTSPNNTASGMYSYYSAYTSYVATRNITVSGVSNYVVAEAIAVGTADAQTAIGAYNSVGASTVSVTSLAGISIYTDSGDISYYSSAGSNYFKDSGKSDGNGLRVGEVWSEYGLYAESGGLMLASSSGHVQARNRLIVQHSSYVHNLLASPYGGISCGSIDWNYNPTSGTWATESTLLLNAYDYSVIGFNDNGSRVDFIRVGAGKMVLGYDGGFGSARVEAPGGISASVPLVPPLVITSTNYGGLVTPITRNGKLTVWTSLIYVETSHSAGTTYLVELKRLDTNAVIDVYYTDGVSATPNVWLHTNRTLSYTVTTSMKALYVNLTKVGSPGALHYATQIYLE